MCDAYKVCKGGADERNERLRGGTSRRKVDRESDREEKDY